MKHAKTYRVQDTYLMDRVRQRPCLICHATPVDVHHLNTRGSFADDVEWNLIPACRTCHNLFHNKGISFMANKFFHFKEWLIKNGWIYETHLAKWRHY